MKIDERMNNYFVGISIYVGEFEKATYTIITDAPSYADAARYALLLECHNSPDRLEWKDNYEYVEDGLDFIYDVNSVAKIGKSIKPFIDAGMSSYRYDDKVLSQANLPRA